MPELRALARRVVRMLDPAVRDVALALAAARRHGSRADGLPNPLLLGHRGAMARAPENTLGAFQAALDDGAHGVELDVQLSADGVPVVLHDDTLDRTTNLTGRAIRSLADELDAADAGTWFGAWGKEKVPRLEECFVLMERDGAKSARVINVELKGPTPLTLGLERRVVDVVRAHPDVGVIISSFHPAQLLAVRALAPEIPLALLVSAHSVLPLRTAWAAPLLMPDAIHPPSALVDAGYVAGAHRAGMRVHVWAVDGVLDARRLLALGVDGLIVDDVRAMARVL